jgi:hypothetical protein
VSGPKFEITNDTTLGELSGMMRLLPSYEFWFRVYPGHVKSQRYEVVAHSSDLLRPDMAERGPSVWAALSRVMERAIMQHIASSSSPGDDS